MATSSNVRSRQDGDRAVGAGEQAIGEEVDAFLICVVAALDSELCGLVPCTCSAEKTPWNRRCRGRVGAGIEQGEKSTCVAPAPVIALPVPRHWSKPVDR